MGMNRWYWHYDRYLERQRGLSLHRESVTAERPIWISAFPVPLESPPGLLRGAYNTILKVPSFGVESESLGGYWLANERRDRYHDDVIPAHCRYTPIAVWSEDMVVWEWALAIYGIEWLRVSRINSSWLDGTPWWRVSGRNLIDWSSQCPFPKRLSISVRRIKIMIGGHEETAIPSDAPMSPDIPSWGYPLREVTCWDPLQLRMLKYRVFGITQKSLVSFVKIWHVEGANEHFFWGMLKGVFGMFLGIICANLVTLWFFDRNRDSLRNSFGIYTIFEFDCKGPTSKQRL